MIVELTYRQSPPANAAANQDGKPLQKSIYVGWTGMQSKRKLAPLVGREGLHARNGSAPGTEQEVPIIEIDAAFGKLLGLVDGQKV